MTSRPNTPCVLATLLPREPASVAPAIASPADVALVAPKKTMSLGWRLSWQDMASIMNGRTDIAEIETQLIVAWVKLGRVSQRSRNEAPTVLFAMDSYDFIFALHCRRGPFTREFVTEQAQLAKDVFKIPESADSTFGWHECYRLYNKPSKYTRRSQTSIDEDMYIYLTSR
ncbi:hypothetical protein EXIGLDRAFT_708284, partial [Exidia glandulosa HHB12029]